MDQKRAHASALELEDGSVVISGNWYATDCTEFYNSSHDTVRVDTTSDNRSYPILLPVTRDNVWIVGGTYGSYGTGTQNVVDQTKGKPFSVDLLTEWSPRTPIDRNVNPDAFRLAGHTFLIPALNAEGRCAPLLVDSMGFSLLPMEQPIPMEGPWGTIKYSGSFWAVPETQTAWLMGQDKQNHVFLAEIDCQPALQRGKARLAMHYTQAIEGFCDVPWEMMLPDGSFVTAGGMATSNYDVSDAVFAFYPTAKPKAQALWWVLGLGAALLVGLLTVIVAKRRKQDEEDTPDVAAEDVVTSAKRILSGKLEALMEEQQLFRNKDLRIADVVAALHTNTNYLSAYLNGVLNTSFPAFITGYRIRYAQELMRKDPMMRLSQVAEASGFTNEKSFLRSFKAACGVTPSEWKQEVE